LFGFFETGSLYVAQAGLKLIILLHQPFKCTSTGLNIFCKTCSETKREKTKTKNFLIFTVFQGFLFNMSSLRYHEVWFPRRGFITCVASIGFFSYMSSLACNELQLPNKCFCIFTTSIGFFSQVRFLLSEE
jgi:hypothetical protein